MWCGQIKSYPWNLNASNYNLISCTKLLHVVLTYVKSKYITQQIVISVKMGLLMILNIILQNGFMWKIYWEKMKIWLKDVLGEQDSLAVTNNVLLGYKNTERNTFLNCLLLFAKFFIYRCKVTMEKVVFLQYKSECTKDYNKHSAAIRKYFNMLHF